MISLILAAAAGLLLGLLYFGTLWLTVRRLPGARRPVLLMYGSFLLRTVFLLAAFYLVMGGRWERLAACLVGFILGRLILVRRLREIRPAAPPEEG